ncbi:MAG: hypothetical protein JWR26_436 [Pedosphaera sp.]|nr:hypothetical protein [Pedosphaera sp.]
MLTVGSLFGDYLLKYVFKDRRTNDHKRLRKVILGAGVAGIVINQCYTFHVNHKRDVASVKNATQMQLVTSNQQALASNQMTLANQNASLLVALSTNPAIDLKTRAAIVDSNKKYELINSDAVDLANWVRELQSKQLSESIEQEKNHNRDKENRIRIAKEANATVFPIFDSAIRKFTSALVTLAAQRNDSVSSSYNGLPDILDTTPYDVGEITFKNEASWQFRIFIQQTERVDMLNRPFLCILCKHEEIAAKGQVVALTITPISNDNECIASIRIPGESGFQKYIPISGYQTNMDEIVRLFIAAQAKKHPFTNK